MENKNLILDFLNKIFICLVIIIALMTMNLIYNVAVAKNGNTKVVHDSGQSSEEYNSIKGMNSVNAEDAIKLFDSKTPEVIYFGRPDCGACNAFLPTLLSVQDKLKFKTNYANINIIENDKHLQTLLSKMDKKTEVDVNGGEKKKGTFGEFYGITPTVIIVKDGKMVAGTIGAKTEKDYIKFLNKYGIK